MVCGKKIKGIKYKEAKTNVDVACLAKNQHIKNEDSTEQWTQPTISDCVECTNKKRLLN